MTGPGATGTPEGVATAAEVLRRLNGIGATLATCESLTGGLLGATLTSVPGASTVYRGGLVTYATDLKHLLADVDTELLAREGAVAAPTARAMAAGARARCRADWAIAVTGVAGPDPQEGQPVGTVFIGISGPGTDLVEQYQLPGDRQVVRATTVETALRQLLRVLGS